MDWAPLLAKPLTLPQVAPGTACPVSPQVSLNGQSGNGPKKAIPNYGYGSEPFYLSGQIDWYAPGSQVLPVITSPSYSGPVLARMKRLDGAGTMAISTGISAAQALNGGAVGIPATSSPPYWGIWYGVLTVDKRGCYGVQFDGTNVSVRVVIEVKQGPPPPG